MYLLSPLKHYDESHIDRGCVVVLGYLFELIGVVFLSTEPERFIRELIRKVHVIPANFTIEIDGKRVYAGVSGRYAERKRNTLLRRRKDDSGWEHYMFQHLRVTDPKRKITDFIFNRKGGEG